MSSTMADSKVDFFHENISQSPIIIHVINFTQLND